MQYDVIINFLREELFMGQKCLRMEGQEPGAKIGWSVKQDVVKGKDLN